MQVVQRVPRGRAVGVAARAVARPARRARRAGRRRRAVPALGAARRPRHRHAAGVANN